ncbi:chemotaxis protein CheA [Oceanobacter mangrovi]|uniref:chemotaxis protein CheA n=1 Tax=Oceanobacter mangrovi TaxID=2862510 RepID=UPI001C8CFE12|nr:chemotaxis protein CheA [Oceanobacter mangrovi]
MSIDLSQFHQVFFEESFEGLDAMESELLNLSPDSVDAETVNTIFRAAHSIKGGAGTFGFVQISEFTHDVETLLDEIRSGQRALTQTHVDLFLQTVDCLRAMMTSLNDGDQPDMTRAGELKQQLKAILAGQQPVVSSASGADDGAASNGSGGGAGVDEAEQDESASPRGWKIRFVPALDILQTGNEPFRMFRELQGLTETPIEVLVNQSALPEFSALEPEQCYLSWTIRVYGEVAEADLRAVFEWVEDDCQIDYIPLGQESESDQEGDAVVATELQAAADSTDETANKAADEVANATAVEDTVVTDTAKAEPTVDACSVVAEVAAPTAASANSSANNSAAAKAKPSRGGDNSSIRVSIDKVDSLINMVGELVITQSMLGQLGQDFDLSRLARLQEGLAQLEQNTRELQESVMKIRMMPISFAFSRFPRLVRDLGTQLGKKVNLVMLGENTELDKTVMEKIGDPLVHLVRNSLDHGLETTEKRKAAGKPESGTITLNAFHQGGNIVIEVKDDGAGLNEDKILAKAKQRGLVPAEASLTSEEIHQLIFLPGFSTADQVSDISGRGVGMDVVRRNINELNGTIEVKSQRGTGSTFVIRLPLTLAILDGQLVKVCNQTYIFPLVSIVESIQLQKQKLNNISGSQPVMKLRDEYIPILRLDRVFNLRRAGDDFDDPMLVVVEGDNEKIGIVVDDLLGQQQVVIKSLEQNYQKVAGVSGATILGDGTVALIIDISGIGKKLEARTSTSGPDKAA